MISMIIYNLLKIQLIKILKFQNYKEITPNLLINF